MFSKTLLGLALAGLITTGAPTALAAPGPRAAQVGGGDPVTVTVTVIHATKDGAGVAAPLKGLERYLKKSFKGFTGFKKVTDQRSNLDKGAAAAMTLPDGTKLRYTYEGADKKGFLKVHLEVGGMKSTVRVRDGGTFFQAGRKHQGGIIILAFGAKRA